jgi:cysteine-rich repeat protein
MPTTTRYMFSLLAMMAMTIAVVASCRDKTAPPEDVTILCGSGMYRAARQDICVSGTCGNGSVDPGEDCDDGNRIAGDGCSADCDSAEACGNGVVDQTVGEVCDDGNVVSGDACCSDCRSCPELGMQAAELAARIVTEPRQETPAETQPCIHGAVEASPPPDAPVAPFATVTARRGSIAPSFDAQIRATLDQALTRIADLERTNTSLHQALEEERRQLADILERITRGRTTGLQ